MTQILYPPDWMNEYHWLITLVVFSFLAAYCWGLFVEHMRARTAAHAVAFSALAGIASMFFLIQSKLTPIEPVWLFAVERTLWWPLMVASVALMDMYAAEMNGHRSLIARWLQWYENRRKHLEE